MKLFLGLLVLFLTLSAHSWEAKEDWSSDLNQELVINCESNETLCRETCNEQYQCRVEAGYCRNCIGTNLFLSYFYQEVGRWFSNSKEKVSSEFLKGYLQNKNFILLTASGPYNIFTSVNDMRMEQAFNSLCPSKWNSFPVVIGALNRRQELTKVVAVICHGDAGAEIFKLNSSPEVESLP
jgi:hypothetical protein